MKLVCIETMHIITSSPSKTHNIMTVCINLFYFEEMLKYVKETKVVETRQK